MLSTWYTPIVSPAPQIETSYASLTESEIADLKSCIPFETPFVAGVRTIRGDYIRTRHPIGHFRMVDPIAVEAAAARRRQRRSEEFKRNLAELQSEQDEPVFELTRKLKK